MRNRIVGAILGGGLLVLSACSEQRDTQSAGPASSAGSNTIPPISATPSEPATSEPATTEPATTEPSSSDAITTQPDETQSSPTSEPAATSEATSTTTAATTAASTTTTVPATTTTTIPAPLPGVANQECVIEIAPGDSLSVIVSAVPDETITVASVQTENRITDPNSIAAGDYLDICIDEIDDITGEPRPAPPPPPEPGATTGTGVEAQQQKLNDLFGPYGLSSLPVDGDSGRLTEQWLCAARLGLGMPADRSDVEPGSAEEQALMSATGVSVPAGAPTEAERWILIDKTCQIMFVGEGSNRIVFVFRTSTGEPGYETRDQSASRAFRFNPALDNGGWHDSSDFPVTVDNPLNGNMYKPLYFDGGQAIHGANNVPSDPQSKGCARLRVENQEALIAWLGIGDVDEQLWDGAGRLNVSVSIQGQY